MIHLQLYDKGEPPTGSLPVKYLSEVIKDNDYYPYLVYLVGKKTTETESERLHRLLWAYIQGTPLTVAKLNGKDKRSKEWKEAVEQANGGEIITDAEEALFALVKTHIPEGSKLVRYMYLYKEMQFYSPVRVLLPTGYFMCVYLTSELSTNHLLRNLLSSTEFEYESKGRTYLLVDRTGSYANPVRVIENLNP